MAVLYRVSGLFCSFNPGSTPGTATKLRQAPIVGGNCMTNSHLNIDFNQERPTNSEVDKMLSSLTILPLPFPDDKRISTYLDTVKEKYSNGGTLFYQFQVQGDKTFHFFASRNRLAEIDFINQLFQKQIFKETAKELKGVEKIKMENSNWRTDIFSLPGNLARIVYYGGAYSHEHFSAENAFNLSVDFVDTISEKSYADFNCWTLGGEWSDWFFNIAWDYSVLLFDKAKSIVTLICMTDTD